MRFALCNEVLGDMPFERQCVFAATLGYDGLEIAPFTLSHSPHRLSPMERTSIRRAARDAGIAIASLHWLLLEPPGLSITSGDPAVRSLTLEVLRRLIELCADLGGTVLVHGSPAQRRLPEGPDAEAARARGREAFAIAAEEAARCGVTYCLEALSAPAANFITRIAEAAEMVARIGNPHFRTMIDCSAAAVMEAEPLSAVIDRWLPTGLIAHVQLNDRNRRGPGQGQERFPPVLGALQRHGYRGWAAVEPFDYHPDGPAAAARAIGYLRGIEEGLSWRA